MVLFSIGLALEKFKHYSPSVDPAQKSAAKAFLKALGTEEHLEQGALQKFLFALYMQGSQGSSQYAFTIYCFLILRSFHQKGNLSKSSVITQYISKIVFFGRGAIFNKICSDMEEKKSGYHT